ncbi:MAG: response regulator [Candidatus Omnitrophica bacterium]|nr:response regulator [Candidatus Omnitrophota bacterium]MDE2008858.1 response regulator [Candidatus Omnitrophota bacterium]MDE2213579.1 response regulator [Candidatus Omnitrophota bacterium]MDE2230520.1 response regulator [Candidatus Omnitrophota bacterium]
MKAQIQPPEIKNDFIVNAGYQEEEGAKQILIVDDERKFCEFFQRIFTRKGLVVFTASNNFDASIVLASQKIDLVILDINLAKLPDGFSFDFMSTFRKSSGSTLFELMKVFHKNIKVIVSSVCPINEQKERISGADGYFDKTERKNVLVRMAYSFLQAE